MKPSKVSSTLPFLERPEREGQLPVLTDEVHPDVVPAAEPVLRLAWDDSRLPVLTDVIEEHELSWKAVRALRRRDARNRR
jgi:hypothetical protein